MKFKGDIIITDPCYIMRAEHHGTKPLTKDDWDACDYGQNMEALGIKTYLTSDTEYGDWSCTTIKNDEKSQIAIKEIQDNYFEAFNAYNFEKDKEKAEKLQAKGKEIREKYKDLILGSFCADAGLVSVFLLDEVLAYNPDFDYHKERNWTTTLIKDFDGDIDITHREFEYIDEDTGEKKTDSEVSVIGKGNIDFYTTQTGL